MLSEKRKRINICESRWDELLVDYGDLFEVITVDIVIFYLILLLNLVELS